MTPAMIHFCPDDTNKAILKKRGIFVFLLGHDFSVIRNDILNITPQQNILEHYLI
jgi:hypothetical protein